MKISFDFDNTLSKDYVQDMALAFLAGGMDVWVTTSRRASDCTDVHEITDKLGIDRNNIQFTHFEDKVGWLQGFDIHFDDDEYEINLINRSGDPRLRGILVGFKDYRTNLRY